MGARSCCGKSHFRWRQGVLTKSQMALLTKVRLGIIACGAQDIEGYSFSSEPRNTSHLNLFIAVTSRKMILTFSVS